MSTLSLTDSKALYWEDKSLHNQRCENLKSYANTFAFHNRRIITWVGGQLLSSKVLLHVIGYVIISMHTRKPPIKKKQGILINTRRIVEVTDVRTSHQNK
jgi:hypothetical protein